MMARMVLVVVFIVVMLGAIEIWGSPVSVYERAVENNTHVLVCTQLPIELAIVLDSSSSISHPDFKKCIVFLQNYIQHFQVGTSDDGVRVSIITYGKGIYPEDGFNLTTYNTLDDVIAAIGRIPHRSGLYTDTGRAIQFMHTVQLAPDVVRSYAEKVALVITDGNSQEWQLTQRAAEDARADGIKMFAIGVGHGVLMRELLNIAGDPSRVTTVKSYEDLESVMKVIATSTCVGKPKPTTPPPPLKCGEKYPTDVYFAFSPGDLGQDLTPWVISFVLQTINNEGVNVGFQYGVVAGLPPEEEGFDLDTYVAFEDYRRRVEGYNDSHFISAVSSLTPDSYSVENGGRVGARKVAVLIINNKIEVDSLNSYVQQLVDNAIQVYIADPTGFDGQVEGAVFLHGSSAREQSDNLISLLCEETSEL